MPQRTTDVAILGAGIIGAAVAWRLAQRGLAVTLVDPTLPAASTRATGTRATGTELLGAWHTAAGMLAPVTEGHYTETPLLRLGLNSARRYAAFVDELTHETGCPTGYRDHGTVVAAWDAADLAELHDLRAFLLRTGADTELLDGSGLRALEPATAAGLPGGLYAPGDHSVDPRLLHAALLDALTRRGARTVRAVACGVAVDGARAVGVLLGDGTTLPAERVVLAAGSWSGRLVDGVPVRPVKGQTLRLRLPGPPVLTHALRGRVRGSAVYLVPRADGEIVVGASVEEAGFDVTPRAGAVYELLRDAQSLVPELADADLAEICTGLRPGTPDNAPLIGPGSVDGLVLATGHHRNGVLLAPVTADAVTGLLVDGVAPDPAFAPQRFAAAHPAMR